VSYNILIKAENKQLTVTGSSGDIPDGIFSITGHEGGNWITIGIARSDTTGLQVAQASGSAQSQGVL